MTAFDSVWALLKADIDFITTTDPEELARKRSWLYGEHLSPNNNYLWPSDEEGWKPEGQEAIAELLDKYGDYGDTLGQANTFGGYEQIPTWDGTRDGDAIIDTKGRALINLPMIFEGLMDKEKSKFRDENPRPELYFTHPDYNDNIFELDWDDPRRDELQRRNDEIRDKFYRDRARHTMKEKNIGVDDTALIDEIIRIINHEVGHTTQSQEEQDWEDKYTHSYKNNTIYDKSNPINDLQRKVFMQESLASIFEQPHDLNWKKRIAQYGGMGMEDYHDKMREISYGMAKFFDKNPDIYRSKEQVLQENKDMKEWLDNYNKERIARGDEPI